jgi:hypothetical protein
MDLSNGTYQFWSSRRVDEQSVSSEHRSRGAAGQGESFVTYIEGKVSPHCPNLLVIHEGDGSETGVSFEVYRPCGMRGERHGPRNTPLTSLGTGGVKARALSAQFIPAWPCCVEDREQEKEVRKSKVQTLIERIISPGTLQGYLSALDA